MSEEFRFLGRPTTAPSKELDTFPKPPHVSHVRFVSEELTSLCPVTGQPDFYRAEIEYSPNQRCIESKSLKLYLWSFRNDAMFAEQLANDIAEHVFATIAPHTCKVTLTQNVRGGLELTAVAEMGE